MAPRAAADTEQDKDPKVDGPPAVEGLPPATEPIENRAAPDADCVWPAAPLGASAPTDHSDEDVRRLQELLTGHGWYVQPVPTGFYDVYTEQAVQQLQRAATTAGMYSGPIDGQFGEATRHAACAVFPS